MTIKRFNSRDRSISHTTLTILAAAGVLIVLLAGCQPIRREMDQYLRAAHDYWGFEGTVLVAYDGRVILKEGYGMADQVMGIPNTPQTKFFIGSLTKQFTAAAILCLQEKGLLTVGDTIAAYLPDFPVDKARQITIHHLLTHTSGIPNYTDFPEIVLRRTDPIRPDELYDFIRQKPLEFDPGKRFRYSNSGYIVLGEIIKRVSGQSYEAFLHKEILKPSGMFHSGYARREACLPDRAIGYTTETGGPLVTAPLIHFSVLHTAGALYSTVEDMLKWDKAITERTVLSDSSIRMMFTPQAQHYGYGWYIDTLFGQNHAFHSGLLDGFNTFIDKWPDSRLTIIVFSNDDNAPVDKIARGLARIVFRMPYDLPMMKKETEYDLSALPSFAGVYQANHDQYHIVSVFEDKLFIHAYGEPFQQLMQQARDTFFLAHDNTRLVTFERDSQDVVIGLTEHNEDNVLRAPRLSEAQAEGFIIHKKQIALPPETLRRYTGTYSTKMEDSVCGAIITLRIQTGTFNSIIAAFGEEKVELFPHSETEFFHQVADFLLRFTIDDVGIVRGCSIFLGGKSVVLHKAD